MLKVVTHKHFHIIYVYKLSIYFKLLKALYISQSLYSFLRICTTLVLSLIGLVLVDQKLQTLLHLVL